MNIVRTGITREVIITNKYAIKIPKIAYGLKHFLLGWGANINENFLWQASEYDIRLCPVKRKLLFGLVLIMHRVDKVCETEEEVNYRQFKDFPGDSKPDNFGVLKGRIVKLDYGEDFA